jgi:hypothetical protein
MNFIYLLLVTVVLFSSSIKANSNNTCDYIFTIIGGSTAANTGAKMNFTETKNVLMWNNTASDWQNATYPLLGSYGSGSSPWLLFARNVSVANNNAKVCLIGNAHSATIVSDYYNGKYTNKLENAYRVMSIYPDAQKYVLCMLGEENANYKYYNSYYYNNMKKVIELGTEFGITWFISQTSYNPWNAYYLENKIRDAQYDIIHNIQLSNVYAGPNTDSLCNDYRYNSIYFNERGIDTLVTYWFKSFNNKSHNFYPNNSHCDYHFLSAIAKIAVLIFMIAVISGMLAVPLMCFYCIKQNRYDDKVYYYINSVNNKERTSLLYEDKF